MAIQIAAMDELGTAVDQAGGALTITMLTLRDAYGAGRLGVHVRDGISNKLRGMGLGHYPVRPPEYQDQPVRIYRLGSPIAAFIDAVLNPSPSHDEELRQAAAGGPAEVLERIKALICG